MTHLEHTGLPLTTDPLEGGGNATELPHGQAVGVVFHLSDGTIQACNQDSEAILGFTLAQMQASSSVDHLWQTVHEDGSPFPGHEHPAMVALQTGQPVSATVMGVYRPEGTLVWITINAQPLFQDSSPEPWAVVSTFCQISAPALSAPAQTQTRSGQGNQQLPDTTQQFIQKERLTNQIAQQIHRSLTLEDVLQTAAWEVRQFLHTDRVMIFQFEPNLETGRVVVEAVEAPWTALLSNEFRDPCFVQNYAELYRQGRVTAISDLDITDLEPCYREFLRHLQVRANLVVPILRDDLLWGLLVAQHCAAPRVWQQSEIDLLLQLAAQIGMALHRVELYQQAQLELAGRRETEVRLQESQEQLELGVQVAGVALAKFDYQTNCVELSPEAAALYGLPVDELLVTRDRVHATFHPDEREELLEIIRQVIDPAGTGWFAREHRVNKFFLTGRGTLLDRLMQCWLLLILPIANKPI
jgi:GAF domain-containing protein